MARQPLFIVLSLACGLSLCAGSRAFQEQESPIFRIQVDMVLLNVAVTDSKGNYVTGLQPKDFQIYEDGIMQNLATFAEGNEIPRKLAEFTSGQSRPQVVPPRPFSSGSRRRGGNLPSVSPPEAPERPSAPVAGAGVFILFDTSNYMYRGFVFAQDAISDFVRSLDRSDRVAFYSFSRDTKRVARMSADRQLVLRAVRNSVAGDDVALYNALLVTLKDAAQLSGRKMIVVFSNGPDNASMAAPESVRELAQAEGIPIYMISTQEAKQDPVSTAVFERLSVSTGGKAYFAKNWREQQKAFGSIREELARLYMLSYYPQSNPNRGWRSISVKLVGDNLKKFRVRTRIGYRPRSVRLSTQISGSTP